MRHDEYRRLHLACLGIAKQCSSPQVQARWLAIAQMIEHQVTDLELARRRFVSPETQHRTQTPHSGQASMLPMAAATSQKCQRH